MKALVGSALILFAGLQIWSSGVAAQQSHEAQPAKSRQLPQPDEKVIRQILKDQETAWNTHDMKGFTKSLRDDAEGINIVGMYWRGKTEILNHLEHYHATNFKDLEEYLEEAEVHATGDSSAIAVSIWKVGAFTAPNGAVIPACRHRSTGVFEKSADGWKMVHFHNTTIDEAALKNAAAPPKR